MGYFYPLLRTASMQFVSGSHGLSRTWIPLCGLHFLANCVCVAITGKQVQDVGERSTVDHVGAHVDFSQKQVGSNQGGDFDLEYALRWPERRRLESTRNSATGKHNGDPHLDFASRRRGHRSFENTPLAQGAVASDSPTNDPTTPESRRDKIRIEDTGDFDSELALRWPEPHNTRRIEWPDAWRSIGELQEREHKQQRKHKGQREPDGNEPAVRTRRPFHSRRSGADPRFADSRRKIVTNEAKSGAMLQH